MFEEIKQMNAELDALKAVHLEKSKGMFTKVAAFLFEKHPKLESFQWEQFTPYFNDGEECTFSARVDYPQINGEEYGEGKTRAVDRSYGQYDNVTRSYPNYKETPNPDYDAELDAAGKEVKEFLNTIDEQALRDMFGDHKQIKVTREGTEVEDYDHE